jgi:DNA primase
VIIPCYWKKQLIGYTARAILPDVKPKFHSSYESNYVFNTDKQHKDNKFVIVCEGPFDAMSIDGVAVLGAEVSEQQADIIDSLGKEVIVVPDFDMEDYKGKQRWAGIGLVKAALEYGWSVSFPVWNETCKDINEAVVKYGKLFVIKSIIDSVESSKLKIELKKKKYG